MRRVPTIIELELMISNELKSRLGILDDETKKNINAVSAVLAGQMKMLYLSLSDIQDNSFVDRATSVSNGGTLERIGNIHLNRNPNPATQGIFLVDVVAEEESVIRSGLTFKSNDDSLSPGNLYITESEVILEGQSDQIIIRSLGVGTNFNLNVGDVLTITEPVIGVDKEVVVSSVISTPLAAESLEDYRQDIIFNIQSEPSGGSAADYRLWSSDAQGVLQVYPYLKDGSFGIVQIYVEATVIDSIDGFGTPSQDLIDSAESVINFDPDETKPLNSRGRKPIQSFLEMLPVNLVAIDISITNLVEDDTSVRELIRSNLVDYLSTIRPFIAGADLPRNKSDILFSARVQSVITDSLSTSNFYDSLDLFVDGVNQISFIFDNGNIPYLRNLTFV